MPETGQTALLGPVDVVASPDGKTLYVADAKQISVVDADGGKVSQSIAMPAEPSNLGTFRKAHTKGEVKGHPERRGVHRPGRHFEV